ncbi:MAG: DUF4347 domain-containing protein, partial [Desulfovibrionales bacterium]|nr:DUF4347 domain-containing protein [Desulfovibrionales bacterium]
AEIAAWSNAFTDTGDILIYGCDVAQTAKGEAFVQDLAELTGTDVAASINPTGAEDKGGDWVLEHSTGPIETGVMEIAALQGVLDDLNVNSIVRQWPTGEITNADTVVFRVTFDKSESDVTNSNFLIAPGSVSTAVLQSVQMVEGSDGTQYDVTISGLKSSGTINIDVVGNNPDDPNDDQSYTIDKDINPGSITDLTGGLLSIEGDSTTIITGQTSNLQFSGTADAGDTVSLYIGGTLLGSAQADANGDWSLNCGDDVAEGEHILTIRTNDVAGNMANATATLLVDITPPVLDAPQSSISDIIVTLDFNEALATGSVPNTTDFAVTLDGAPATVTRVVVEGDKVSLTLDTAAQAGQAVRVSYTGNTLQDLAGNKADSFSDKAIDNVTKGENQAPIVTAPTDQQWYSLGDAPAYLFGGAFVLADNDDTFLEKVTITITGGFTGDTLAIDGTLPGGIEASFNSSTGTLTLTGHASMADYEQALQQVTFKATDGRMAYNVATNNNVRTISVIANDGQDNSISATTEMRVLGPAFPLEDLATSFVWGNFVKLDGTPGTEGGFDLQYFNLVTNKLEQIFRVNTNGEPTTETFDNFTYVRLNALGFNPMDGHIYAVANCTDEPKYGVQAVYRIDADGKVTQVSAVFDGTNGAPPYSPVMVYGKGGFYSGDIDAYGYLWIRHNGKDDDQAAFDPDVETPLYAVDLNPQSTTFGQWVFSIPDSKHLGEDFAFVQDGSTFYSTHRVYVDKYKNEVKDAWLAKGTVERDATGKPIGVNIERVTEINGQPIYAEDMYDSVMQYADTAGNFYYNSMKGDQFARLDTNTGEVIFLDIAVNVTSGGDAARIATIKLDFGDADFNKYKTVRTDDGARHNQLKNEVWLGDATTKPTWEIDARPTGDDNNGIAAFLPLTSDASSYSVDIQVTGKVDDIVIGWIDFNGDGVFGQNEAASHTLTQEDIDKGSITLSWTLPTGTDAVKEGDTWARFRIASAGEIHYDGKKPTGQWAVSDHDGEGTGSIAEDKRSYGLLMNGEVEDYKITISSPDDAPPEVCELEIVDGGGTGPRFTTVGEVKITFSEPVKDVDVTDFVLTRDGETVILPGDTPVRQDPNDASIWYIDLSDVTSPSGEYTLSIAENASITDPDPGVTDYSDNDLVKGGSISFVMDNTAPVIDLDSGDDTTRDHKDTYNAGQSTAISLDNSTPGSEGTVEEDTDRVTQLDITVDGLFDGNNEILVFGTTELKANGSDTPAGGLATTVGGVSVLITYADGTFTLTPTDAGGAATQIGEMSASDAQDIVRDISYKNDAGRDATVGDRTFAFTVTDKAESTASPAVATIAVVFNNTPPVPTDPETEYPDQTFDPDTGYTLSGVEDGGTLSGRVYATDAEGDEVTYTKLTDPAHGTLDFHADGTYTYTPDPDYNGNDSFTVQIDDGYGGVVTTTV